LEKTIHSTKTLTGVSFLSASGLLLMILNTALPLFPFFLRIDLGDLPVLIGYRMYGLKSGIAVAFMKNFLHLFLSQTMGIGELLNFLLSVTFLLCLHFLLSEELFTKKIGKSLRNPGALVFATIATSLVAVLANYTIMLPLYNLILGISPEMILSMVKTFNPGIDGLLPYFLMILLPFNLMKFGVLSLLYYLIERNLRSVM